MRKTWEKSNLWSALTMSRRKNLLCEGKIMFPFATKSPAIPTLNSRNRCFTSASIWDAGGFPFCCLYFRRKYEKKIPFSATSWLLRSWQCQGLCTSRRIWKFNQHQTKHQHQHQHQNQNKHKHQHQDLDLNQLLTDRARPVWEYHWCAQFYSSRESNDHRKTFVEEESRSTGISRGVPIN